MGSTDEGYIINYRDHKLFNNNNHLHDYIGQQPVLSLATDQHNHLWVLAKHSGLLHYDLSSHNVTPVNLSLPNGVSPYFLFVDKQGYLWMTTNVGTRKYKTNGKDRKSTRLNSSHANISYAVFCLNKKISSTARSACCRKT